MSHIIVVTGGVACGKSTVVSRLSEVGAPVISADHIAREVVMPEAPGHRALQEILAPEFFSDDGVLNRRKLRHAIFNDKTLKRQVEQLLHPLIRSRMQSCAAACRAPYVVMDIPLYAESHDRIPCDEVWVVDCPFEVQLQRLMKRDGIDKRLAENMISAQASREKKLALATQIIDNSRSLKDLVQQVDALHLLTLKKLAETLI